MLETTFSSRRNFLVLLGCSVLVSGCSTIAPGISAAGAQDHTDEALPLVNRVRSAHGLPSLSARPPARVAAAEQAARMAKAEQMTHLIGLGDSFATRMKRRDVPLPAAENIASGQTSVEEAVQAWIESERHLKNMLGSFSGVGVAVAQSPAARPYWAMVLSA
jgi:Uncharacterized protein with SCP/PR1 domains